MDFLQSMSKSVVAQVCFPPYISAVWLYFDPVEGGGGGGPLATPKSNPPFIITCKSKKDGPKYILHKSNTTNKAPPPVV